MISNHVKNSTPGTCETEVVVTDTFASIWHSFHYVVPFIFWENCVFFQTAYCVLIDGTNSTAKAQTNSTANISDSFNISGWKIPLIYLSNVDDIALWRSVILSLSTKAVKLINSSARMALKFNFFMVSRIRTSCTNICSQLILQEMCEFSIPKSHKTMCPNL